MKLTFMRSQIELKFKELQMLVEMYAKGVGVEMEGFEGVTDEAEQANLDTLMDDLEDLQNEIGELFTEFDVTVSQLTKLYNNFLPRFRQAAENDSE